jgi:hypothetical protein
MPSFNISSKNNNDFCYKWLSALSGLIPLTKKELLILSMFLAIYLERQDRDLFNTTNRKVVKDILGISTYNINNYINTLKSKNAIFIEKNNSGIKNILIPQIKTLENGKKSVDIKINIIL